MGQVAVDSVSAGCVPSARSYLNECANTSTQWLVASKGKVKVWDVVNEALADGGTNMLRNSLWLQIIGPDFGRQGL